MGMGLRETNTYPSLEQTPSPHKIPHGQRIVFAYAQRDFVRRMHRRKIDSSLVTFEGAKHDPVACMKQA
ncbi:hypothetical protein BDR04DRAFT_1094364 [Suillus decipiens]|nr:hypothetical protein BDR04DRAFT_1094364 [Suillus decipiens]